VAIGGRNPENVQNLADELGARAFKTVAGAIDSADLTVLAVPDDVIAPLAEELPDSLCSAAGKSVVHLSGAQDRTPLDPLRKIGMRTGVFHPLQTFKRDPEAVKNIPGSSIGIDADQPLKDQLWFMAERIGAHPFDLSGIDRVRYHAAAVLVANYSVTLLGAARKLMADAGMDADRAQCGLRALLQGTVNNLKMTSPKEALTGPAARGDTHTIERHLDALANDPKLREIYRLLAERSRNLKEAEEEI
jgi:predicted short-subunit dehydrogenase-like oxidoreductase (DUF2520 family)